MPKILKLKVILKEIVKNLNCRGINSSMRDPLKMVQKALDKYTVIYCIVWRTSFGDYMDVYHPAVTGIDEAIERNRKTHTGHAPLPLL